MNDPHVVALIYQIEHGSSVNYSGAEPLDHEEAGFRIRVKNDRARFEFKEHYATKESARKAIEEYIRNWEFVANLQKGPNCFKLKFDSAEIIDRKPSTMPGTVDVSITVRAGVPTVSIRATADARSYPPPPSGVSLSRDVKTMHSRYMDYLQGREHLATMAYFCLTVLVGSMGRKVAAKRHQVEKSILDMIGCLSSKKGGRQARKAGGTVHDLTDRERRFLEEATKVMIYRAAEKAQNPDSDLPKITLSDLPLV